MQKLILILFIAIGFLLPKSIKTQPINTLIGDVVMPPPDVASLGKYGDIPVDFATGVPNISIPIHTLQQGPLSLDVGLSYHAGGITVGEMATWTGLGWTLNSGGLVSRTVLGMPDDEGAKGYYYNGGQIDATNINTYCEIADGAIDGEPDIFQFSAGPVSGKFFFDSNRKINVMPANLDVKINEITEGGLIVAFEIILIDGSKYTYGNYNNQYALQRMHNGSVQSWTNSWCLLNITSYDNQHTIDFNYQNYNYSYKTLASCYYNAGDTPGIPLGPYCNFSGVDIDNHFYNINYVEGKRLLSISTVSETINFHADNQRDDIDPIIAGGEIVNSLDALEIITGVNPNRWCKKYHFTYDYFDDPSQNTSYAKRLKLNTLQEISCNEDESKPPFIFTYNGNYLPHRLNKGIDHWGYYNGKGSTNGPLDVLVPPTELQIPSGTISYGCANRNPDPEYVRMGTLQQIDYPTGGNSAFEFEPNQYLGFHETSSSLIPSIATCGTLGPACCGELSNYAMFTFTSQDQINSAVFDIDVVEDPSGTCTGLGQVWTEVIISDGIQSFPPYRLTVPAGETQDSEMNVPLANITDDLIPGVLYTFTLVSKNGRGNFSLNYLDKSQTNVPGPGIRIKKITHHNGMDSSIDIIRNYRYEDEIDPMMTSGVLLRKPKYVEGSFEDIRYVQLVDQGLNLFTCQETYHSYYRWTAHSVVPLGDYNGLPLLYSNVKEELNGSGFNEYKFDYDLNPYPNVYDPYNNNHPSWHPPSGLSSFSFVEPPRVFSYDQKRLKQSKTFDNSQTLKKGEELIKSPDSYYTLNPGHAIKAKKMFCDVCTTPKGAIFVNNVLFTSAYKPRTGAWLLGQKNETLDGVSIQTTNTYDIVQGHHQVMSSSVINSDGKNYETQFSYASTYDDETQGDNASVEFYLKQKNVLLPWKTEQEVDNVLVDGNYTEWSFYGSGGVPTNTPSAYLLPFKMYRYIPTRNGNGNINGGAYEWQVEHELYDLSYARPKQTRIKDWTDKFLYNYEINGLLKDQTFKDHTTKYDYYLGTRLLEKITNIDNTSTIYDYDDLTRLNNTQIFSSQSNLKVEGTTEYYYNGNSNNHIKNSLLFADTDSKITESHVDGLGRQMFNLSRDFVGGNDIKTQAWKYDNQGRVVEELLLPNGSYKSMDYEDSPLHRLLQENYPDGSNVTYLYEANQDQVQTTEESYGIGALFKTTFKDENSKKTVTFKDILGRDIQTINQRNGTTSYDYYLNSTISKISTPENHLYTYKYFRNDLVEEKQIPGQVGNHVYTYDDREFLQSNVDPNGTILSYEYDDYGRQTKTFKGANGELIHQNFYDNYLGVSYNPNSNSQIANGKLTASFTKTLDVNPVTIWETNHYDQYGRIDKVFSQSHIAGKETAIDHQFNLADQLLNTTKVFDGLNISEDFTYDTWDRELSHSVQLTEGANQKSANINSHEYNLQGLLRQKNLGGNGSSPLQSLDYRYNTRGWLRTINQSLNPLFTNALLPSCEPVNSNTSTISPELVDPETMTALQFLENRFDVNLIAEEFEQCTTLDCEVFTCDASQQVPIIGNILTQFEQDISSEDEILCADGSSYIQYEIDLSLLNYPFQLVRVRICDGSEYYIPEAYLFQLPDDYQIMQTINVVGPDQNFSIEINNEIVELDLLTILQIVIEGSVDPLGIDNYVACGEETCTQTYIDCDPTEVQNQESQLQLLQNQISNDPNYYQNFNYPMTFLLVALCNGEFMYLTQDEYDNYIINTEAEIVGEITIDGLDDEIALDPSLTNTDLNDLFFLQLDYQANGNIKDQFIQVASRKLWNYKHRYDGLNRLSRSIFSELFEENGQEMMTTDNRFGVTNIRYDDDGNIKQLIRRGITEYCSNGTPQYGNIDRMFYTYGALPNRLQDIDDRTDNPRGFPGNSEDYYSYDNNGNIKTDPYKGITIDYNYMNLPNEMNSGSGNSYEYIYDASGLNRQTSYFAQGAVQNVKDYFGNIEYEDGQLKSIYLDDLRLRKKQDGTFSLEYGFKDHLGNTRLVFNDKNADGTISHLKADEEIIQENHYYSFGMGWDSSEDSPWFKPEFENDVHDYQYNGKELFDETVRSVGEYEVGLGMYSYGFRFYDPAIGRFTGVDPISDQFPHVSTYNYAENSPISNIDLHGLQKVHFTYVFGIEAKQTVPSWVPFGHRFVDASLTSGTITDFNIDLNAAKSYSGTFKVPARISATSGGYIVNSYDTYTSSGENVDEVFNSENWDRESNLSRAFAEGMVGGWNTASFEGAAEMAFAKMYNSALSGLSRNINGNKQSSHIVGTNAFKIRKSQGKNPSVLSTNAQTLLDDVFNANISSIQKVGQKYRVNFGKVIGQYVDPNTGKALDTTVGLISTGKKGAHIVPGRPID